MRKKLLAVMLTAAMVMGLTACAAAPAAAPAAEAPAAEAEAAPAEEEAPAEEAAPADGEKIIINFYEHSDNDKTAARQSVSSYFGRGNGQYYRAHHGEILLSPKQQEDILKIVSQFGPLDGIKFEHYKVDWDFE